jgi:hypothetical protein
VSCHSTQANVVLLRHGAHSYGLSPAAVETEFHWLKKIGKTRAATAPSPSEWTEFLLQREQWIRHDSRISERKRENSLTRLVESYEQVPDGPTFYALSNLPARLSQVTAPESLTEAAGRVRDKVMRMTSGGVGKDNSQGLNKIVTHLAEACRYLKVRTPSDAQAPPGQAAMGMLEEIQRADFSQVSRAELYGATKKLLSAMSARL